MTKDDKRLAREWSENGEWIARDDQKMAQEWSENGE